MVCAAWWSFPSGSDWVIHTALLAFYFRVGLEDDVREGFFSFAWSFCLSFLFSPAVRVGAFVSESDLFFCSVSCDGYSSVERLLSREDRPSCLELGFRSFVLLGRHPTWLQCYSNFIFGGAPPGGVLELLSGDSLKLPGSRLLDAGG